MTKKPTKKTQEPATAAVPIRHGDVGLFPIATAPTDLEPVPFEDGRPILAYGEVTGHKHRLDRGRLSRSQTTGKAILVLDEPGLLDHEEHGPITVPAGTYEVTIAREVDLTGVVRNVAD